MAEKEKRFSETFTGVKNDGMRSRSYFDKLKEKLNGRKLSHLWELKLTDEEYNELKSLLVERCKTEVKNADRFLGLSRECTLFFAEYWHRMYNGGPHEIKSVYESLGVDRYINEGVQKEFYEAAKRGTKNLGLPIYENENCKQYLDSMLYQGGLPMKFVVNTENSNWNRFTKSLINGRRNFDDFGLGVVAEDSKSLESYCNQLVDGVDRNQCKLMPFYCENENNEWFLYLKRMATEERRRRNSLKPFSLSWKFEIDKIDKKIGIKYLFEGKQKLPSEFLNEHDFDNRFFSVKLCDNKGPIDTFDYNNKGFSRYKVFSEHSYKLGDIISVFINNQEMPYISSDLNMDEPHLLYKKDSTYELGNKIGELESLLLMSEEDWELKDGTNLTILDYTWNGFQLKGIEIPKEYSGTLKVVRKETNEEMNFGKDSSLYWTDINTNPIYMPNVVERIYNAKECSYSLCWENDKEVVSKKIKSIEYRAKWQNGWVKEPPYGEIYARVIDDNVQYCAPIRFINVGEKPTIEVKYAGKDSCKIRVLWTLGNVSTRQGELKADNVWEISKDKCEDSRIIEFVFTPQQNDARPFTLSVKAPFKDFSIIDDRGGDVLKDALIPYIDIDKYQYHIVGQDVLYSFASIERNLKWIENELYIYENGQRIRLIPYQGSLINLFDSRERLQSLLEHSSLNIVSAEVKVCFSLNTNENFNFSIKEYPYRAKQEKNRILIEHADYKGKLKLFKLDEPKLEPKTISKDSSTEYYCLPEEIRKWGKTILTGYAKGRILPTLVDLTRDMDADTRRGSRKSAINSIKEKLRESRIGDEYWQRILDWYDIACKESIPASSILELCCVAQDSKFLLLFALQLYAKCTNNDEREVLKEQLLKFSNDLAFQWYWLRSSLGNRNIASQLNDYGIVDMDIVKHFCSQWVSCQGQERLLEYLNAIEDDKKNLEFFLSFLGSFEDWLKELFVLSLIDKYGQEEDDDTTLEIAKNIITNKICIIDEQNDSENYIEINQYNLDENIIKYFESKSDAETQNLANNEIWLSQRVNVVYEHLINKIDLFTLNDISEDKKDEIRMGIRRSIIYCCKIYNHYFLKSLNNKLFHKK